MTALIRSTEPATRRTPNRAAHFVRRSAPKPAIRSAGAVPMTKRRHRHCAVDCTLLQRGDQQDGINEPAGHPAPDHAEGKCARPARNRQQATTKRCESVPDATANEQHPDRALDRMRRARQGAAQAQTTRARLGVLIRHPTARSIRRAFRRTAGLRANMKRCARADSRSGTAAVDVHRRRARLRRQAPP